MDKANNSLNRVGEQIRAARELSGLTLHQLARLSGISAPALSQIETGKRDLRISSLYRVASALRVDAGDLLRSQSPSFSNTADGGRGEGYDLDDYQ